MDFARKQLEKYGWKEGQGLGKNNTGSPNAIKQKLKFDKSGLGHKITDELVNPWWQKAYDNAAKNISVKKDKKRTVIETIGESEVISTKKRKSKYKDKDLDKSKKFVKVSALTVNGEERTRNLCSSDSEDSDPEAKSSGVLKLTDEELFKACGGRTVHKGARHGVKMNAKLARIEEQEKIMLELLTKKQSDRENSSKTKSKKLKHVSSTID